MLIAFVKEVITKSVFNAEELKQQTRNSFDSKLIRSKLPKCFGEKKTTKVLQWDRTKCPLMLKWAVC